MSDEDKEPRHDAHVFCGQSNQERRTLRGKFRELQSQIVQRSDEIRRHDDPAFQQVRHSNNDLFRQVSFPRESVLDSINAKLIADNAAHQIDKMVKAPRYDVTRVQQKLRRHFCTDSSKCQFDWKALALQTGACFNAVPPRVSFLSGPLEQDHVAKQRKKRKRKVDESDQEYEEEQPEDVKNQVLDKNQMSAVERNTRKLAGGLKVECHESQQEQFARINETYAHDKDERKQALAKLNKDKRSGEIDAINYLFNPDSFTKTVENIFNFSFLVQHAKARMQLRQDHDDDTDTLPGIKLAYISEKKKEKARKEQEPKQTITSLNMRDWRQLCQVYNVEKKKEEDDDDDDGKQSPRRKRKRSQAASDDDDDDESDRKRPAMPNNEDEQDDDDDVAGVSWHSRISIDKDWREEQRIRNIPPAAARRPSESSSESDFDYSDRAIPPAAARRPSDFDEGTMEMKRAPETSDDDGDKKMPAVVTPLETNDATPVATSRKAQGPAIPVATRRDPPGIINLLVDDNEENTPIASNGGSRDPPATQDFLSASYNEYE